jgi:hypothetical protein
MIKFLRRLYSKLPIIRELKLIERLLQKQQTAAQASLLVYLESYERQLLTDARYTDPKRLNLYEHQTFSQGGEDGIIAEIFRRIGTVSKTFVEIGVESGIENNTAFLLAQGWHGYWIEGNASSVEAIHTHFAKLIASQHLTVTQSFVTSENIAATFQDLEIPHEIDILSIDIDRNTYWTWNALPKMRAGVVVVEYNSVMPSDVDWKVEYHPRRVWNGSSYFGASLKAFELLGSKFGYNLVGCNLCGSNAFFVRKDLCRDRFAKPFTSEHHYEPARFFLARRKSHPPSFIDDK